MPRGQPRWWNELLLVLVVYGAYSTARVLAQGDADTAMQNGLRILNLERALSLNAEHPVNELFTSQAWLGVPASFAYASLHYLVTPLVLLWLYKRRPRHYRLMRTWLLTSTLLGLIGFVLYPTTPPRLLDSDHGFVDTLAYYGEWGWWTDDASAPSGLGDFTNQHAAMPSLHVGWALWCGIALWHHGRRTPLMRVAAVAYPATVTIVVMGTANHYLLDAVAGAAVMILGLLLTPPVMRLADRLMSRIRAAQPVPAGHGLPPVASGRPRRALTDARVPAPGAGHNGPARRQEAGQIARREAGKKRERVAPPP